MADAIARRRKTMTVRVLVASNDDEKHIRKEQGKGRWLFPMPKDSEEGEIALIFTHQALIARGKITQKPPERIPEGSKSKFGNRPVRKGVVGNLALLPSPILVDPVIKEKMSKWRWPKHPDRSFCTPAQKHANKLMKLCDIALGKKSRAIAIELQPRDDEPNPALNGGSGYEEDPLKRRAIELHAMELAEKFYRAQGFEVEDVSKTQSYDLCCTGHGREVHVEVKGTTTGGSKVELTINEVNHARGTKWRTDLFVVSEIKVTTKNGEFKTAGGKCRIATAWNPAAEDLAPIRFCYTIPTGLMKEVTDRQRKTKSAASKSKASRASSAQSTHRK